MSRMQRRGLQRWVLGTGLLAGAACSGETSSPSDAASGGSAGAMATGGVAGSGNDGGSTGGRVSSGADGGGSPSAGGSPSGGEAGSASLSGAPGTGGATTVCGDGDVEGDEACDDGFTDSCGTCNATCSEPGTGSVCDDAAFCEETELGVCDCSHRPLRTVDDGTLRFVVLGDGGTGGPAQFQVAEAVLNVCEERGGCDFALYLGDNIYEVGVTSVDDPQFEAKFEEPYCGLAFPFYVALGNHDYGNTSTLLTARAAAQIEYGTSSTKWTLPDFYYSVDFEEGSSSLEIFALDTPQLEFDQDTAEQASWFEDALSASTATWKLVFGHHTYVSNGPHGNAGSYDATSSTNPIATGEHLQDFFDAHLCPGVDLYLSGHDHSRQWLEAECGLEVVVSGAAAKRTSLVGRDDNMTYFQEDEGYGFAVLEIDGDTLVGRFYDEAGTQEFERTLAK